MQRFPSEGLEGQAGVVGRRGECGAQACSAMVPGRRLFLAIYISIAVPGRHLDTPLANELLLFNSGQVYSLAIEFGGKL